MTATLRLLAVTPLEWWAGYDELLLAVREVLDAGVDVTLRVEAEGSARERYLFHRRDLGLVERASLSVPRSGLCPGADALVSTAREGRDQPELLEASARARTLVCTDVTDARCAAAYATVVRVAALSPHALRRALLTVAGVAP